MPRLSKAQSRKRLREAGKKVGVVLNDPNMAWLHAGLTPNDYRKLQAIQQDLFKFSRKMK